MHLAHSKSENSLIRCLGRSKLQLYLLIYANIWSNYYVAEVMY